MQVHCSLTCAAHQKGVVTPAWEQKVDSHDCVQILALLALEDGDVADWGAYVPLPDRIEALRAWAAAHSQPEA